MLGQTELRMMSSASAYLPLPLARTNLLITFSISCKSFLPSLFDISVCNHYKLTVNFNSSNFSKYKLAARGLNSSSLVMQSDNNLYVDLLCILIWKLRVTMCLGVYVML